MARQLDLFAAARGGSAPAIDSSFHGRRRIELAHGAWIDLVPDWVRGHEVLFEELERTLPWRSETMTIHERVVDVPRLLAGIEPDAVPLIRAMRDALSHAYGEPFVRVTAALYRGGDDSVAMHGDTTARDMISAVVATVSLGAPRRFVMRPTEGGPSRSLALGRGDLVVMGGTFQRTWRHGIPKVAAAEPRIAVMFRPAWARSYR
jgi:alkylated DNA repair dioxygenase AlkB